MSPAATTSPRTRRLPDWRSLPPPSPDLEVSVIVPVRDEARRLPATLRALAFQCELDGAAFDRRRYEVIVLANNCSDASADIVRAIAARHAGFALHVVEVRFPQAVAHVGHARACLMNEACRRLRKTAGTGGVIASTDGDTRVTPDWIAATLAEIASGVDAVGGRIVTADDTAWPPGLERLARRDNTYQRLRSRLEHVIDPDEADPWPRHHQHFGASLAITVDAYRRVGGLPALPFLEDEALVRELRRHDLRMRHSERVSVVTSSRRQGRVAVGLSWQLREWAARARSSEDAVVDDPMQWARVLATRRRLRELWRIRQRRLAQGDAAVTPLELRALATLSSRWNVPPTWLARAYRRGDAFGALWSEIEARIHGHRDARRADAAVPMARAIVTLRSLIADRQAKQASRTGRAGRTRVASR